MFEKATQLLSKLFPPGREPQDAADGDEAASPTRSSQVRPVFAAVKGQDVRNALQTLIPILAEHLVRIA